MTAVASVAVEVTARASGAEEDVFFGCSASALAFGGPRALSFELLTTLCAAVGLTTTYVVSHNGGKVDVPWGRARRTVA